MKDALVFPGGKVEECDFGNGQDPLLAAAIRETQEETGLRVDPALMTPFSWWVTPKTEKRRYDTRFFVGPYPTGQEVLVDTSESEWGQLFKPSELLLMHQRREAKLMPPTMACLEAIAGLKTLAEVRAKAFPLEAPICPELVVDEGGAQFLAIPEGLGFNRTRFKIGEDGRFY